MNDKKLMFGVIGCFAITIFFLGVIIWEIQKSVEHDKEIRDKAGNSGIWRQS
jgi:hypothetical protein